LYFCHRYSGRKLSEIEKRFGIGLSGVTQASGRIDLEAKKEKKLGKLIKRIENNFFYKTCRPGPLFMILPNYKLDKNLLTIIASLSYIPSDEIRFSISTVFSDQLKLISKLLTRALN